MNKEYQPFERVQQNNFSYWYPKIEHCGIQTPRSIIIPVPNDVINHFYMDNEEEDIVAIQEFVETQVKPRIKEANMTGPLFVKNGTYSDKFNAGHSCLSRLSSLTESIININYGALMFDAGGHNEIIIRQRIPFDPRKTPCIYNGLPFRSEFRVFYDFDDHEVIFTANYWDYDYVYHHLYDLTDRIIFDHQRKQMEEQFNAFKGEVEKIVAKAMRNVDDLDSAWSIDLLLDEKGEFWLIDMAVAEQSAYWEKRPGIKGKEAETSIDIDPETLIEVSHG